MKSRTLGSVVAPLVLVVGCGGGVSPDVDGAVPDAAVDAVGCVVPATEVIPASSTSFEATTAGPAVVTANDRVVVFASGPEGLRAHEWDGVAWTPHVVFANVSGSAGLPLAGVQGDHALFFATVDTGTPDDGKLRYWEEQDDGEFAAGQLLDPAAPAGMVPGRTTHADGVTAVAGYDYVDVTLYERADGEAAWTHGVVHDVTGADQVFPAGIGALSDGTRVVATYGTEGFLLYRRDGATWSVANTLAPGNVPTASLTFPPAGSAGAGAVGVYVDPISGYPRGLFASVGNAQIGTTVDLLQTATYGLRVEVGFAPDGRSGSVLLYDDNQRRAWVVDFADLAFAPAREVHPELYFEAQPRLVAQSCSDVLVLHATHPPTAPSTTMAAVLEPLAAFAQ